MLFSKEKKYLYLTQSVNNIVNQRGVTVEVENYRSILIIIDLKKNQ